MTTSKLTSLAIALIAVSSLAAPAAQAQQSRNNFNDTNAVVRGGVGAVGGQVGRAMCGSTCATVMKKSGQAAYDTGQKFTSTYSPVLQRYGYETFGPGRKRLVCRGGSGIAGSTPQACVPRRR